MAKPWHRWPAGLRQAIFDRDGHRCQIRLAGCTGAAEHVDHITPAFLGGAWFDPDNLRAACKFCNLARSNPSSRHNLSIVVDDVGPSRRW